MNKQEQIQKQLAKPFEVGDKVDVMIPYTEEVKKGKKTETVSKVFRDTSTINKIEGDTLILERTFSRIPTQVYSIIGKGERRFPSKYCTQNTFDCGENPFQEYVRVDFLNIDIESLLHRDRYEDIHGNIRQTDGFTFGGINFNPYIVDQNGTKRYYQRPLVWTTKQKQLLIDSIYNNVEIGKFILKYNSWSEITKQGNETGHGYSYDCVDGKQRFHAMKDFMGNVFPDSHGNYWDDLSTRAQVKFKNYSNLSYGQLSEGVSDENVLKTFLSINFTGEPMSQEHIDFVRSINV